MRGSSVEFITMDKKQKLPRCSAIIVGALVTKLVSARKKNAAECAGHLGMILDQLTALIMWKPTLPFHITEKIILSPIFYACEITVFGEKHQSSEHAYQLSKALRAGSLDVAEKIRNAKSALEAKRFGSTVKDPNDWDTQKLEVMEEIVSEKAEQVKAFRERIEKCENNTIFAEATHDAFWGTGLDPEATEHTDPNKWPGSNKLEQIVKKVAHKYKRRLRSVSIPRRGQHTPEDPQTLDKFLCEMKKNKKTNKKDRK